MLSIYLENKPEHHIRSARGQPKDGYGNKLERLRLPSFETPLAKGEPTLTFLI